MSIHSALSNNSTSSWYSRGGDSKSASGRSQLHWKLFRREVLAPHHIRIVETVSADHIPESIITWINANRSNTARFNKQRQQFRKQVESGRAFGSSALFPQEVLPPIDAQPFLSRCMVPSFSDEALPERKLNSKHLKSKLSLPRPGLGCGFSSSAFAPEEVNAMPSYMLATGTTVHFDTGSISSGAALYCPFMSFERAFNQNEYGLEIASNQCAVDGAWSVRALQMLYAKANIEDTEEAFDSPVAFTCAVDNEVAVINYHWVDHAQTYCMAPVVKFELSKDDHFDQFLVWTEAIGQWALTYLLPDIKKAISLLGDYVAALPALVKSLKSLDTIKAQEEQNLVSALKLSYNNIPWRYDNDDFSPVSSSTASWGSPMINEAVFAKFEYPIIPQPTVAPPRSVCSDSYITKGIRFAGLPEDKPVALRKQTLARSNLPALPALPGALPTAKPGPIPQPPAFEKNTELVLKKRLGHAMDEIQDLQAQLTHLKQELSGSTICLQNELSGLRKTMTCVIRKEKMGMRQRSPLRANGDGLSFIQTEQKLSIQKGVSVVTTPTDPTARRCWPGRNSPRKPSGLQNVLSVDTNVSAEFTSIASSPCELSSAGEGSPITIFSPTIINVQNNHVEDVSSFVRVPAVSQNLWSPVLATHVLSVLVPSTMLRIIILGCLLDYMMMTLSGNHKPSVSNYLTQILDTNVY